jgi:hypothetical protein
MVACEQQRNRRPEREARYRRGGQPQSRDESGCRIRPVRVTPPLGHVVGGAAPWRIPRDEVDVRVEAFELLGPNPRVLEYTVEEHQRGTVPRRRYPICMPPTTTLAIVRDTTRQCWPHRAVGGAGRRTRLDLDFQLSVPVEGSKVTPIADGWAGGAVADLAPGERPAVCV